MSTYFTALTTIGVSILLAGCFQTELGGAVAGAKITITDLRSGDLVEERNSRSFDDFIEAKSLRAWNKLDDLGQMINLGNFDVEPTHYTRDRWYLVTANGGGDMDPGADGIVDEPYSEVAGSWHALMTGRQLREGGYMISTLTEALYQTTKAEIDTLDDQQLQSRLNQQTRLILPDLNEDGSVNYLDALEWTVLVSRDAFLRDFSDVVALSEAIRQGERQATLQSLAGNIFAEPKADAFEFYSANISGPIVQARCVNCHTAGGVAPNRGARLVLVTNSTGNFKALNHEAFQDFRDRLRSDQDLSDYVTGKASNRIGHGGGVQLTPGSQQFRDMETYLNLIE